MCISLFPRFILSGQGALLQLERFLVVCLWLHRHLWIPSFPLRYDSFVLQWLSDLNLLLAIFCQPSRQVLDDFKWIDHGFWFPTSPCLQTVDFGLIVPQLEDYHVRVPNSSVSRRSYGTVTDPLVIQPRQVPLISVWPRSWKGLSFPRLLGRTIFPGCFVSFCFDAGPIHIVKFATLLSCARLVCACLTR